MSAPYWPIPSGQDRSLDIRTVQWFCKGCPYLAIGAPKPETTTIVTSGTVVQQGNVGSSPVAFSESSMGNHEFINTKYHCTSPAFSAAQAMLQDTSTIGAGYCPFLKSKLDIMYDSITDEGAK